MSDYTKFFLFAAFLCVICPPLIAFLAGVGIFVAVWYVFFRILTG
jgi:hypothetical protein